MKIEKLNQQYLKITAEEECEKDEWLYASKVLQKKKMEGLLPLRKRSMDGQLFYYYSIEGVHSMEEVWDERFLTEVELEKFLRDLEETIKELEGFLLRQEQLQLNPSYIMYDVVKRKWKFMYLLQNYESQKEDVDSLLDFWMNKLGGLSGDESKMYEYLADCMMFEENILPSELVHLWTQRASIEAPVSTEENIDVKDDLVQKEESCTSIEEAQSENEWVMPSWKGKWNKLVYEKLYLVPFSPH